MDNLVIFSKDKATLKSVRDYLNSTLRKKLVSKALRKEDITGFADAASIIKIAMDEIDAMSKPENQINRINQSE